jgi:hypothetical protein
MTMFIVRPARDAREYNAANAKKLGIVISIAELGVAPDDARFQIIEIKAEDLDKIDVNTIQRANDRTPVLHITGSNSILKPEQRLAIFQLAKHLTDDFKQGDVAVNCVNGNDRSPRLAFVMAGLKQAFGSTEKEIEIAVSELVKTAEDPQFDSPEDIRSAIGSNGVFVQEGFEATLEELIPQVKKLSKVQPALPATQPAPAPALRL